MQLHQADRLGLVHQTDRLTKVRHVSRAEATLALPKIWHRVIRFFCLGFKNWFDIYK